MGFFNETGQDKARKTYRKWWVGKYCRIRSNEYKLVVDVETRGCTSFVTGVAYLIYEDGEKEMITFGPSAYRPRKKDVEVKPNNLGENK
jgi:hypothetical protein